jgi:hypothetical protein
MTPLLWLDLKHEICRRILGPHAFFSRDASLEIDRLIVEIERLREENKRLQQAAKNNERT